MSLENSVKLEEEGDQGQDEIWREMVMEVQGLDSDENLDIDREGSLQEVPFDDLMPRLESELDRREDIGENPDSIIEKEFEREEM